MTLAGWASAAQEEGRDHNNVMFLSLLISRREQGGAARIPQGATHSSGADNM